MDSFVPNPRQAAAEGDGDARGCPRSVADVDLAHAVLAPEPAQVMLYVNVFRRRSG